MDENPYKSPESGGEIRRRWNARSLRYLAFGLAMMAFGGISWWLSWQMLILNWPEMNWGDVTFFGVLGAVFVFGGLRVSLASLEF